MKKFLALMLAAIMAFSMVATASATSLAGTYDITVWVANEIVDLTKAQIEKFNTTNELGIVFNATVEAVSEADAATQMITDVEAGGDIYCFAQDQFARLVQAGALAKLGVKAAETVSAANTAGVVAAATAGDELYAYPMTADNGYFMYYDKSVFTEEDITSWESMLDAAEAAGKKILFDMGNAWYTYGFFAGAGLTVTLNSDGSNTCDWASDKGVAVAEAMMKLASHPAFLNTSDSNFATLIADGTICAGVNGTWNADAAKKALGDNYGACKLPTYTLGDGTVVQTGSFSGYKMVGVNPYSKNLLWAMKLANYVTNEQNQALRFEERHLGPSNLNVAATDDVKADIALAALLEQSAFSTAQNVGGNFWSPVASLGGILAENNPDNIELIDLLTQCVEGVEAPLTDE